MDRDSSDDSEDDRESLINQNDRKPNSNDNNYHHPPPPTSSPHRRSPPSTTFHIEELGSYGSLIRRRFCRKRFYFYMLAIFIPLFLIVIYFSADMKSFFSYNLSGFKFDSGSNRMREAELQSIYLLNQQRLSLLSLLNQSSVNSFDNVVKIQDFRSALLKQITLNKQIEQVLLSPHSNETVSGSFSGSGFGYGTCKKVDSVFSNRKTIEWKPKSDKFLFPICLSGQMSNHLICLEKHMFFAALLNRVLVIPSSKFDYQFNRVLDIEHINECVGRKVVVTFEEFLQMRKNHVHIDRFICYFSEPTTCYIDEDHVKKLKGLGISMGKLESPWKEDIKKPSKKTVQDVLSKFTSDDGVIAIGDVFYADLEQEWVMQPGGPLAHKCKTLIEPSRLILLTAQRFIQTFLGKNFIALHFRRHGFLKFCNAKNPSCFYPIPQAAECIARVAERANSPVIYLSTDAADSETDLLQSLIVVNGKIVPLVKRPSHTSVEKWDSLLSRHGIEDDPQVDAMLDKTICAMANVFIGASGSTFTEDILRLRKDWESASLCDEYLCQGELPNFIAENE
ncbi:O-fucosyltransferase 36 [Mercurialis annua]|uniref:O-fucosyltransferase 36 n=1 Tax=Mercurialis annua TaxID=3986 RepID=UPI00215E2048|nr:O-fucosyltransferase 36 [Mercurialis annua]